MNLPTLKEAGNLEGARIFLSIDMNLPVADNIILDSYKIERSKKTLEFLKKAGARVILVSHRTDEKASLLPIFGFLKKSYPVKFAPTLQDAREMIDSVENGSFVMLENIRKIDCKREKENNEDFAKELASLADIFVNEAFSASHRAYASIVGVPKFLRGFAGFLFEDEIINLSKAFSPAHPALLVLGGAKFETKIPLVKKFLDIADNVYLCGALANDVYIERGYEVGTSLVSGCMFDNSIAGNKSLIVPIDVVVNKNGATMEKKSDAVLPDERIVDLGATSINILDGLIKEAKFILWNGPLGEYEAGFDKGTIAIAEAVSKSNAETIIGGGDSVAVAAKEGLLDKFSFVSTGGGAMLEFLADGTLPGIQALHS